MRVLQPGPGAYQGVPTRCPVDWERFSIAAYCLIDETLLARTGGCWLRPRGPAPALADSEVLTIECVGSSWTWTPTPACPPTSAATMAGASEPHNGWSANAGGSIR